MTFDAFAALAIIACVAFSVTYLLVPISIWIAKRLGAVDQPSARRVHKTPTARMGGISIFAGIMSSLFLAYLLHKLGYAPTVDFPDDVRAIVIAFAIAVMFAVGVIDDVKQVSAWTKLVGQIIASAIAVAGGILLTDIHSGQADLFIAFGIWAYPITVFYLVAFANIVNLIDGLDGLAAGVATISGVAFFALSCQLGIWATAAMAVALVASCLAFLRFNFHPAKLFMGDCGSLTLGFILGIISLMGTMRVSSITSLAVPVVIAAIPVLDTFAAIVRRKRNHVSIGAPDKGHIHHSLLKLGFGQRRVVLTIYGICILFAASGVMIAGSSLEIRIALVLIDLTVAAGLVWKLGLFGKVLGRYYPDGIPKNFTLPFNKVNKDVEDTSLQSSNGRLKILVVCQHYWPETFQITDICEELVKRGHRVTALVGLPNYPSGVVLPEYRKGANRIQERNGVHIVRAKEIGRGKNPIKLALNYYSYSISATGIVRQLPKDYDIVFSYQLSPVMMATPAVRYAHDNEKPLLMYCCDLWPESLKVILGNRLKPVFDYYKRVSKKLYQAADIIDVQSPSFPEYFSEVLGMKAKKIVYVPQFATGEFVDMDLSSDHEGVHISVLGNIGRAQDVDVILDAVSKMETKKKYQIHFVGEGPVLEEMIALSQDMGIDDRVTFHGRKPASEMPEYYRMSDACLMALNGDSWIGTTLPSRLQGYMAAGKPVIAAIDGGANVIIKEANCGLVVSAGDDEGLARILDDFVENNEKYSELGVNGREYFKQHFSREIYMDTIEHQLLDLVKES